MSRLSETSKATPTPPSAVIQATNTAAHLSSGSSVPRLSGLIICVVTDRELGAWCRNNHPELSVSKIKEFVVVVE